MTPLGWLGRKTSTQTNNELISGQNVNSSSKNNICFTVIFAEKMQMQKLLTFFQQKY